MSSEVWTYFKLKEADKNFASCLKCSKLFACKGASTSGLLRHLNSQHNINLNKRPNIEEETAVIKPKKSSLPSMDKYVKKSPMCEIVARLAAYDGFSIRAICHSKFIRESLNAKNMHLPKSQNDVMKLIYNFYDSVKTDVIQKIETKKKNDEKFSVTLDEWTSVKIRRFLNVNLHYCDGLNTNLGLIRIVGSCSAEMTLILLKKKLNEFNINDEIDIVGGTTDGPAVMVKFGK